MGVVSEGTVTSFNSPVAFVALIAAVVVVLLLVIVIEGRDQ